MSCLGLPSGRGGPMSPSPSSLPRSPRVEVGLFLGRRRLSLPLAHFRHLSSATGAPVLSALHAALNAVSHSWCHAAENWCSLSASVSSFVKQISNGQGLFPALWSCATGMQTIFLFFHISQPGPYLCLQPRRWHRRQMMRAARPTWMATTAPGNELLASWLQEHPSLHSVDTVPSVRGPGWGQGAALTSLKTDSHGSCGRGLP